MLKKTLGSLALATALFACKEPTPQVIALQPSATLPQPGSMSVTGSATLEVAPDCADLTMTISADGGKPGAATAAVKAREQALLAALVKLGVETTDIKLSYLSLEPVYAETEHGFSSSRIVGYRAAVTVTVTTKSFDKIAEIMETGANAGATSMSSQFRRSDLPELKKKVREMALAAAKDKAAQTAKTLGIELGRIVSVNENAGGYMWNAQYFPNAVMTADKVQQTAISIGGAMQPLQLDVTIGFELSRTI